MDPIQCEPGFKVCALKCNPVPLQRELRAQNAFLTAQLAHMRAAGYELPAALDGFDLEEESRRLQRGAEKMSSGVGLYSC